MPKRTHRIVTASQFALVGLIMWLAMGHVLSTPVLNAAESVLAIVVFT